MTKDYSEIKAELMRAVADYIHAYHHKGKRESLQKDFECSAGKFAYTLTIVGPFVTIILSKNVFPDRDQGWYNGMAKYYIDGVCASPELQIDSLIKNLKKFASNEHDVNNFSWRDGVKITESIIHDDSVCSLLDLNCGQIAKLVSIASELAGEFKIGDLVILYYSSNSNNFLLNLTRGKPLPTAIMIDDEILKSEDTLVEPISNSYLEAHI